MKLLKFLDPSLLNREENGQINIKMFRKALCKCTGNHIKYSRKNSLKKDKQKQPRMNRYYQFKQAKEFRNIKETHKTLLYKASSFSCYQTSAYSKIKAFI
jgi:hypothetical protein